MHKASTGWFGKRCNLRGSRSGKSMDSLSSVSPSIVLPPGKLLRHHHRRRISAFSSHAKFKSFPRFRISIFNGSSDRTRSMAVCCKLSSSGGDEEKEEEESLRRDDELERALRMDGTIPGTSNEFVEQVSSRAYDMRRHLQQSFDSSSYDGLLGRLCAKLFGGCRTHNVGRKADKS